MKPEVADPPTPDVGDMINELALGLRDTIQAIPMSAFEADSEKAFMELARRLVTRLQKTIAIVPAPTKKEKRRLAEAEAAARIFDIFTKWMRANKHRTYTVRISHAGRFQVSVESAPALTEVFFGESAQDAQAQAAQTIDFNESAP